MALDRVSLGAADGELVAIVGPNGAGKTALLNCINGVYRPAAGRILLHGRDITHVPVDRIALAGVGRAFQHAELFPHMTVIENLLIGRHLCMRAGLLSGALYFGRARREEAEQRRQVERIIDFFELYRYRDAVAASLPYGVQKLVGVARALALEPKLLLLDEPSSGLNVEETEDMAFWIQDIQHELGITVLMVEHDMTLVSKVSDRVLAMNQGEVLAMGTPREVQNDPGVIEAYLGSVDDVTTLRRAAA
jgi:branched-chain amino acid transport system ATP-binding protein